MANAGLDKFKDLRYRQNSLGPPIRYQLIPKKESLDGEPEAESKLRRWTIGERDHNKPNKTILLVGGTGAGKSTLINAMFNYVIGVEWEDKVWFEIVEENEKRQTWSITSEVTVYEIFGFEDRKVPFSLTIIDTPGYGNTDDGKLTDDQGIEEDFMLTEKLQDLFRSKRGIQEINVACLVVKASDNRLSDRLKHIFNSVISLFRKNMEKNTVALFTHSDGLPATSAIHMLEDAKIKCAKDDKDQPIHFMFNNHPGTVITEETEEALEYAWKTTRNQMDQFSTFLKSSKKQKLKTQNVLTERLTACIGDLQERIQTMEMNQKKNKQIEDILQKNKEDLKTAMESEGEVDEPYTSEEVPQCMETCDPDCTSAMNQCCCGVMKDTVESVLAD